MNDKILYGKKVILFEFVPADMDGLAKLLRNDKQGYMGEHCLKQMTEDEAKSYLAMLLMSGQIKAWSVYAKHIKHPKPIGFVYLHDITSFSSGMSGIMDYEIVKGLGKKIREGRYTFSEDTSRTLINHCFNGMGLNRLETTVIDGNRRALLLDKKVGWQVYGTSHKAFKVDNNTYKDVFLLEILKEDWKNE